MATIVQRNAIDNLSTGGTLSFGSNVTSGNRVIVFVAHSYLGCAPTIADSLGSTFTKHVNGTAVSPRFMHLWSAPLTSSGANTITVTFACGSVSGVYIAEVSGLDGTTPFGGSATNTSNSGNPVLAGSITPTVNGSYLLAWYRNNGSLPSYTPMSGWTEALDSDAVLIQDAIQTTAATINPEATASSTPGNVVGASFFFNATAGGGGSALFRPYFTTG